MPVTVKIDPTPKYGIISKVGSLTLEHGVKGRERELLLAKAKEQFVRSMEQQGMGLVSIPGKENPQWVSSEDGELTAWYAIDWLGERPKRMASDGEPLPTKREESLEDSQGEVEYRCVGIFYAPMVAVPMVSDVRGQELAAKNQTQFGFDSQPKT